MNIDSIEDEVMLDAKEDMIDEDATITVWIRLGCIRKSNKYNMRHNGTLDKNITRWLFELQSYRITASFGEVYLSDLLTILLKKLNIQF